MNTIKWNEKITENCEHKGVLIEIGVWNGKERKTGKLVSGPVLFCEACFKKINTPWEKWKELKHPYSIKRDLTISK